MSPEPVRIVGRSIVAAAMLALVFTDVAPTASALLRPAAVRSLGRVTLPLVVRRIANRLSASALPAPPDGIRMQA